MGPHVVSIVMDPAKTLKAHLDSHAGPEGDPDFPERRAWSGNWEGRQLWDPPPGALLHPLLR